MADLSGRLVPDTWELKQDVKGLTGKIEYILLPSQIWVGELFSPDLPFPGSSWPTIVGAHAPFDGQSVTGWLRCIEGTWVPTAGESGAIRCCYQFSTQRQLADDFVDVSKEASLEMRDITKGFTWQTAGTPVEINIPTPVPVGSLKIRVKLPSPPDTAVRAAQGKVNKLQFRGCAPGTLRFDGRDEEQQYALDGTVVSVQTTYKFSYDPNGFNLVWREPVQDVDADGNPLWWQDKDATLATYSSSAAKVGTKFYVGSPGALTVPGTGAYDTPLDSGGNPRYATCDFHGVLGIPILPGDPLG